ncbi:hypothetical protein N9917_03210 [Deltaproteobacteria bacterium]|nr:hypothetical protein [Deltaproteobacteria bacterium]
MPKMDAQRVVKALMQQPGLLRDVRLLLLQVRGAGPWMNTGKRFGDRDKKNVWGLPKFPTNKAEEKRQQEHPNDMSMRKFIATVRPTEEWGTDVGEEFPGKWYWNVDTGARAEHGSGVVVSRSQAVLSAQKHLTDLGWVVVDTFNAG